MITSRTIRRVFLAIHDSRHVYAVLEIKEEEVRGERTEETNASTLVRLTSHVTISPKIHCEQTQM